jgi:hypothetical protein
VKPRAKACGALFGLVSYVNDIRAIFEYFIADGPPSFADAFWTKSDAGDAWIVSLQLLVHAGTDPALAAVIQRPMRNSGANLQGCSKKGRRKELYGGIFARICSPIKSVRWPTAGL